MFNRLVWVGYQLTKLAIVLTLFNNSVKFLSERDYSVLCFFLFLNLQEKSNSRKLHGWIISVCSLL